MTVDDESTSRPAHVDVRRIGKSYGGIRALEDVTVTIRRGEIHSFVGENGAGKSTLGKILAGVVAPDAGTLEVGGRAARFASPRDALARGIALVHQEISLVPRMSVLENIFLGATGVTGRFVNRAAMRREFDRLEALTSFGLEPGAEVGSLTIAQQQKVEIARALARDAELIVFDEPTAPLTRDEADRLHAVLRGLRDRGTTVVFISHFLGEVLDLSDSISVFKDGRHVRTGPAIAEATESLILGMLGRGLEATFPPKEPAGTPQPVRLDASGMTRAAAVVDASLTVHAGEIVGIAGMVGSGRTELARLIAGIDRSDAGVVAVDGVRVEAGDVRGAIRHGIVYLTESRKDDGLHLERSVRDNLALASLRDYGSGGVISARRERAAVEAIIDRIRLRPSEPSRAVGTLSGGNQQKVLLGRCLLAAPRVLILDEPTRGVDIGAKHAIYELVIEIAREGTAVVVISSDLAEVTELAHRIYVMHRGRIAAQLPGDASDDTILKAAFGQAGTRKEAS